MNPTHRSLPFLAIAMFGAVLTPAPARAADADVATLWSKNCAVCHGKDAKGDTKSGKMNKVQDLTDPSVRAKFKREDLIKQVKAGIKDEATGKERMKAFQGKLDDKQIAALVDYILTLKP